MGLSPLLIGHLINAAWLSLWLLVHFMAVTTGRFIDLSAKALNCPKRLMAASVCHGLKDSTSSTYTWRAGLYAACGSIVILALPSAKQSFPLDKDCLALTSAPKHLRSASSPDWCKAEPAIHTQPTVPERTLQSNRVE